MKKYVLYDDSFVVPENVYSLIGIKSFSKIIYRKKSLESWIRKFSANAELYFINLSTGFDDILDQNEEACFIYVPSFLAFASSEKDTSLFLKKIAYSLASMKISGSTQNQDSFLYVLNSSDAQQFLKKLVSNPNKLDFISTIPNMSSMQADIGFIDLRNPLEFTDYLTSNFDVRFFNSVVKSSEFVIEKKSSNKIKIKKEFNYFNFLPPSIQYFFVQPFDYNEQEKYASYKMERLFIPDMSLQWIHNSITEKEFKDFIQRIFHFVTSRPQSKKDHLNSAEIITQNYLTKVQSRLQEFRNDPIYKSIEPYLDNLCGGLTALEERYVQMFKSSKNSFKSTKTVMSHGDLCFSNILYSKVTGMVRLIDPRGALLEEEIYDDELYDIAKLSHSVLGNYDFINHGLFKIELDHDLKPNLIIDRVEMDWPRKVFTDALIQNGFSVKQVRILEASLFISMVPLHSDSPAKVVAFLINAHNILNEVEGMQ